MWKFRYSLTKEKRALTKLLKCVDWADTREVQQAQSLVEQWALVDVQDLLELLGNAFVGAAAWVREFAVAALRDRSDDTQLLSYLLPLVQAIQYERVLQQSPAGQQAKQAASAHSPLHSPPLTTHPPPSLHQSALLLPCLYRGR